MNDDLMRLLTLVSSFFTAPETSGARHNSVDIYTLGTVVMATLYARKLEVF